MTFAGRTSRRVLLASIFTLGAVVLLGVIPWRLVAAESKDSKQSSQQYLATLTISERQKGRPKTVLSAPKVVFLSGQKATVTIGNRDRHLEVTIGPSPEKKPVEHRVQVQIIQNSEGKDRVVLAAPLLAVRDGQTGIVQWADGPSTLEIEATVKPVK